MAKRRSTSKASRKLPSWVTTSLWLLVLLVTVVVLFENRKYIRRTYRYFTQQYTKKQWKPTDFPLKYTIHGLDVSHYQDIYDWNKLLAIDSYGDTLAFRFIIIKATEGLIKEDDMFDEYWQQAREHNLIRGAYHYFLPDRSAKIQATNFIATVSLQKGDLPPVIDVEETRGKNKAHIVKQLKEFIAVVEKQYRVKPIIYSNISFIEDYLMDDFRDYHFWIAHYYRKQLNLQEGVKWHFWQHSDKADVLGIKGKTDANVFNGNEREFKRILIR